jgi:hypothetical protein
MSTPRLISPLLVGLAALACGDGGNGDADGTSPADTTAAAETAPAVPDGSELLAVCETIYNSLDCARAIEGGQLPDADRAARRQDTLLLALVGGDTIRLVDRSGGHPDVVYHSYQDHWTDAGYFHVQRQFYEGAEHVLIDDSTGHDTPVPARPIRSPDGRRFAVLSLDLVAGYGPNTLQIWSLDGEVPEREWETRPDQWGPSEGRWADAETLEFVQHGYCEELGGSSREMCDRRATLRRSGGDWHLDVGWDAAGG